MEAASVDKYACGAFNGTRNTFTDAIYFNWMHKNGNMQALAITGSLMCCQLEVATEMRKLASQFSFVSNFVFVMLFLF